MLDSGTAIKLLVRVSSNFSNFPMKIDVQLGMETGGVQAKRRTLTKITATTALL